jgi:uncharacterized Zn finger protein (UPF0148 family)
VDYYEKVVHVLFRYYDSMEKGTTSAGSKSVLYPHCRNNQVLISNYLNMNPTEGVREADEGADPDTKYVNFSRAELLNEYTKLVGEEDLGYVNDVGSAKNTFPANIGKSPCRHCGHPERTLVPQEGYLTCPVCDTIEYVVIDSEQPSYRDPPKEISYFCYKRQNHFQEWISQTQGREHTNIPEAIYDAISVELKRQKITNVARLTPAKLKEIMKKLMLNKYYEHIPHILNHLSGMQLAHIAPELEQQLRRMFQQIQVPFMKHSPPNRRNFLSYSFVLHKFIQLLEHDELLHNFPLLKSREKLHLQDLTWKAICDELGWQFIGSI